MTRVETPPIKRSPVKKPTVDDIMITRLYRTQKKKSDMKPEVKEQPTETTSFDDTEEQRMYVFALRQLSPLDKGIQSLHAVVEYGNVFGDDKEYIRWSRKDKTVIILNGGTTIDLDNVWETLTKQFNMKATLFREPDLGNIVTAIAVLLPKKYWGVEEKLKIQMNIAANLFIRQLDIMQDMKIIDFFDSHKLAH